MIDINFIEKMVELRETAYRVSPDNFNMLAKSMFGMNERDAQNLLHIYNNASVGSIIMSNDETKEHFAEKIMMAQKIVDKCMLLYCDRENQVSIESYLGMHSWSERNYIGVWFNNDEGFSLQEFNLTNAGTYVAMNELIHSKYSKILCIVPCVDRISGGYNEKDMLVYDGDIFVAYNKERDNYWNRQEENGVYLCTDGAYRRLLYTKGRGYIVKGKEANIADTGYEDNDNVFTFGEGRFNYHILTFNHKWERIGNIHADISPLIERKGRNE